MQSEREKMLAGELYDALDPELVAARDRARDLCQILNASREGDRELRTSICTQLFGKGGQTVWMQPPFFCDYGIEYRTRRSRILQLQLHRARRVPGDHRRLLAIRAGRADLTPMHPFNAELRRKQEYGKPIEIGSDVWVGGGALILPGVRIGSRAVIGAGSVVTRDIPDGSLRRGNPCRVIREIADNEIRRPPKHDPGIVAQASSLRHRLRLTRITQYDSALHPGKIERHLRDRSVAVSCWPDF